jgi:hypothetical protein
MAVSLDGLHPTLMRPRVEALLADQRAKTLGISVVSAYRSNEHQRELWNAQLAKQRTLHPTWTVAQIEHEAGKWVAPPSRSNHGPRVDGCGTAVDLAVRGHAALQGQWPADVERQVNELAERYGLFSPMEWEDWHFEPIPNWAPPTPPPPITEEQLLMAIAKDDHDARRAFVRDKVLTYWGREPTVQEHDILTYHCGLNGADSTVAAIADHAHAAAFRKRRGW